jgi:predicted Zn-dependent protease
MNDIKHIVSRRHFALALGAGAASIGLAGCVATNKATGRTSYTGAYSPADDVALGRAEHPKLVAQFGGAYEDKRLQGYVDRVGRSLTRHTEYAAQYPYEFTLLNSPIVNAFALPGGYVYISRGLLALASSEAEMAGVLAHELGHVNARHSAERISAQQATQVGTTLAAIGLQLAGLPSDIARLGQTVAALAIQGYSRQQEFEADMLGVRYMSAAGYDPDGMVTFLNTLREQSLLEATAKGLPPGAVDQYNMMSTHPRTVDRVREATVAAKVSRTAQTKILRDEYLRQIDGMLFGDDPSEGIVQGQAFIHPGLGLRFDAPPGFRLFNSAKNVVAQSQSGAVMVFDLAPARNSRNPSAYVAKEWAPQAQLQGLEPLTVNGFKAATGTTLASIDNRQMDARLVAFQRDSRSVYRLMFLSPPNVTPSMREAFQSATYSFRQLSSSEAAAVRPLKVRIGAASAGQTVRQLSQQMPYGPQNEAWFRVLNDLAPGTQPKARQRLKLIRT